MKIFSGLFSLVVLVSPSSFAAPAAETPVTVFAAASLTQVLPEVAANWRKSGHPEVVFSFEGSSKLAKQIESGAPADIFLSADLDWADELDKNGKTEPDTRVNLLGNSLVLVVAKGSKAAVTRVEDLKGAWLKHFALAGETVPAGKYARTSLQALGVWDQVKEKVVVGDNVRGALAWVARKEAQAGVVYATDAKVEPKVKVAFTFPEKSHPPIIYPLVMVKNSASLEHKKVAREFADFCQGAQARQIFEAAGFIALKK